LDFMGIPLHVKIQSDLMRAIDTGEFLPGAQLPSEVELRERYAVSRATVRKAMEDLSAAGVIRKAQGQGTYVKERGIPGQSVHLRGYLEDILVSDERVSFKELSVEKVTLPPDLAELFDELDRGPATRYVSLTLQSGRPVMIGSSWIPLSIAPRRQNPQVAPGEQLTVVRLRPSGHSIHHGRQTLFAAAASAEQARHLGVPRGTPVMASRRLYFNRAGRLLALIDGAFHPDDYAFVVDLQSRPGGALLRRG
jgi:GntR family transcriptional regulator